MTLHDVEVAMFWCSDFGEIGTNRQIGRILLISGEIGTVQVKSVHYSVYIAFKRYIIGIKSYNHDTESSREDRLLFTLQWQVIGCISEPSKLNRGSFGVATHGIYACRYNLLKVKVCQKLILNYTIYNVSVKILTAIRFLLRYVLLLV